MGSGGSSAAPVYLLDTCVLVAYVRAGALGKHVEQTYSLMSQPFKPLICEVTVGEILALARRLGWGEAKTSLMEALLRNLVRVDISDRALMGAYADLDCYAVDNGIGIGKNDLWIASAARVTDALLLTTDKGFKPLLAAGLIRGEWIDPAVVRGGGH